MRLPCTFFRIIDLANSYDIILHFQRFYINKRIKMGKKFVRAIFPGSFDPVTNGHLDVVTRSVKLFDELIIAVGRSHVKNQLFSPDERVEMIAEILEERKIPGVSVESFEGLTVEYATRRKADVILRGLRSLTDVQYEFQLAMTNRAVTGIETVFIMTSEQYGFTSSTLIREIASLGGDLSNLIPKNVHERLKKRMLTAKKPTSDSREL
jgi:pantetheine-phosphate adenylyltransferase